MAEVIEERMGKLSLLWRNKLKSFSILRPKQVKLSSYEWINKFIIANLISVIISIICSSDE